jgi:phosphotransferase system enzyme I (PtsI)
VIRLVKQVADVAKDKGIEVFMCGEMAAAAHHIPLLLGLGLDELSMNPQSIPEIKRVIRALSLRDAQDFVQQALKKKTARGVFGLVKEAFGDILDNKY